MKIVVTGGTGFLGRHIVWRAAAAGAEVVFTGRNPRAAEEVMRHAAVPVRWQALEHGQPGAGAALSRAARHADALIHCAALSSPWGREEDFRRANVDSTAEVIAACRDNGLRRLVHVSTPSVYFDFRDRLAIREDAALPSPVNTYARTKLAAEALLREASLPELAILRPRALFGPWDQTLLPRLLRVMRHGKVPLMRGGRILLDLTYVDNAVDAVWLALTRPLPRALNTWNVSNGEPRELLDVLGLMAREFGLPLRTRRLPWPLVALMAQAMETVSTWSHGREPPMTRYSAGVLAFSQTLDIGALRAELGYQPAVSIDEGIRRHAAWWREQRT